VLVLLLLATGLFGYTLAIRKPWLGSLFSKINTNLTSFTLVFSQNWYEKNPIRLRFASIPEFDSIETGSTEKNLYVSWPPGYLLPIYLISKIHGHQPTAFTVQKFNLANHFITAFFLSMTVLLFLFYIEVGWAASLILSSIPVFVIMLMPANLWYQQMTYQAQQAVIPLFVLFVFLEVSRCLANKKSLRAAVSILQFCIFFLGTLTAYVFLFLGLSVYTARLVRKEIRTAFISFLKDSLRFWAPAILGLSLFALQLSLVGGWPLLISRFLARTGSAGGVDLWLSRFWNVHMVRAYGQGGKYLALLTVAGFFVCLILWLFMRFRHTRCDPRIEKILMLSGILLIPCILQVYMLRNHSWARGYTVLKFSIPLSVLPFVLLPLVVIFFVEGFLKKNELLFHSRAWNAGNKGKRYNLIIPALLFFGISILYAGTAHENYRKYFVKNSALEANNFHAQPYIFVRENTLYEDIVFSPIIEVSSRNKASLYYASKQIYKIMSLYDIYESVRSIKQEYRINILLRNDDDPPCYIKRLMNAADTVIERAPWKIARLKKSTFIHFLSGIKSELPFSRRRMDKRNLRAAVNNLRKSIVSKKHADALGFCNEALSIIEEHKAGRYHHRYYLLKLAILVNLGKYAEADHLVARARKIHFDHKDPLMRGWDPNPWSISYIWAALGKKRGGNYSIRSF